MLKFLISGAFMLAFCQTAGAETVIPVKENDNTAIQISRDNYNRLVVEGDLIVKLRFPSERISVEHDSDGSVYIDARDDRPFTLFITTKAGRHFSAKVTLAEGNGETIRFVDNSKPAPALAINTQRHTLYEKKIAALIQATSKEARVAGYKVNAVVVKPVYLKPALKAELAYSLSDAKEVAQKFHLINKSMKPIRFEASWFKNKDTKALLVKSDVIYPNQTLDIVRVQGVSHG